MKGNSEQDTHFHELSKLKTERKILSDGGRSRNPRASPVGNATEMVRSDQ